MKVYWGTLAMMSWFCSLNPAFGQSRFSVSVVAAPNFHYINWEWNVDLPVGDGSMTRPVDLHSRVNGYGYSAGVMASYWISKRLSVATGLWLNQVNYRKPTVTTNPDLNTLPLPYDLQLQALSSTTRSLQVPLLINYRSSVKRLSPYFTAGALTTLYSTTIFEGSKGSKNTIDKIRLHPILAAGVDYRMNDNFSMVVQPTFVYYLPYGEVISYKNYLMGLQAQLHYRF